MTQAAPPERDEAARRRAKEIHYRVMTILGALTTAAGLFAAYLAFGPGRGLPGWMYGRFGQARRLAPAERAMRPSLVRWEIRPSDAFARARRENKLVLIDIEAAWCGPCRLMRETAYADPTAAGLVQERFIALQVDADARPDLALRYLSGGWPTTALLKPSGEALASGTYMTAPMFLSWARAVDAAWRTRGESLAPKGPTPAAGSLPLARERLKDWAAGGEPAFFARFDRAALLADLGDPWAAWAMRGRERGKALEDPVWGGFHRDCKGGELEAEKLLGDQADAVAALARVDGAAAKRTLAYVDAFLSDPHGGYWASQSGELFRPPNRILSGGAYFPLEDAKRRALGLPEVDRRLFAEPNAHMAEAVLRDDQAAPKERVHAIKTLERWRKFGIRDGKVSRELGARDGLKGWLGDQLAMASAFLAAQQATGDPRYRALALAVLRRAEVDLVEPASGAFLDRALDGVLDPRLNFRAWLLYRRLGEESRARRLAEWLGAWSAVLDPAELAAFELLKSRR